MDFDFPNIDFPMDHEEYEKRISSKNLNKHIKNMDQIDFLEEMANFTFVSKYARYNEKEKRRETWEETIGRVEKMHLDKFKNLPKEDKEEIKWAFDQVRTKKVSPSMRSLQFGGKAIKAHELRNFNCSVMHVDSLRSFSMAFYTLLCGTGVGYGLNKRYLSRLPDLVNESNRTGTIITYVVEDNIEGWADSIEALMLCYFKNTPYTGRSIVFDYSKIRRKGTKLKTGGGKAPGYKGLKNAHQQIKKLLSSIIEDKKQKKLKTIDAFDALMHLADATLSGGIRRSACDVVFDEDDEDMMKAKTGNWFKDNPQRARANISIGLLRKNLTLEKIQRCIQYTKEFGEPGFTFVDHEDALFNPCFEIGFIPVTADGRTGVQMCNLTSVNGAKVKSLEDFKKAAKAASLIGTLQASYTSFPYLGATSEELTRNEALLGVSITGILDNPDILTNPENQRTCAAVAVETNKVWAAKLGINQAARVTCVKPEGSNSIVMMAASGIHPHHARKYFRRIQCNKEDNIYNFFKLYNPDHSEESVWSANKTDDVITFPITISDKAMVKKDLTTLKHLEIIKSTQKNWVNSGTTEANKLPVSHAVSCTVIVQPDEWDMVAQYLFENNQYFSAVSLLAASGDKDYAQAPMEEVKTPEDEEKFNRLIASYQKVDFTKLQEDDDDTHLQNEIACAGGRCEVI